MQTSTGEVVGSQENSCELPVVYKCKRKKKCFCFCGALLLLLNFVVLLHLAYEVCKIYHLFNDTLHPNENTDELRFVVPGGICSFCNDLCVDICVDHGIKCSIISCLNSCQSTLNSDLVMNVDTNTVDTNEESSSTSTTVPLGFNLYIIRFFV